MLNKIKIKNKKGQIGEQIEDLFSLLVIILLLAILFLFALLLYDHGLKLRNEKVAERVLNDKTELLLNSIMLEKQDNNIIFSDKIRLRDENAEKRLEEKRNLIKNQVSGHLGYYLDIIYINAKKECEKAPERATRKSCFFIPNDPIAIKMTSVWGYMTM